MTVSQNEIYIQMAHCLKWRRTRNKKKTFENDDRARTRRRSLISDDSYAGNFIKWHLGMACVGEDYAKLCTCHVLTHAARRIVNPRLALSSCIEERFLHSTKSSKRPRECDTRRLRLPGRETTYVRDTVMSNCESYRSSRKRNQKCLHQICCEQIPRVRLS